MSKRREQCIAARRKFTRLRRRKNRDLHEEERALEAYTCLRRSFQGEIRSAKDSSWRELLEYVDGDPWGRPYNLVRNKLRSGAPPITETLDPKTLERVVASLFPGGDGGSHPTGRATPGSPR